MREREQVFNQLDKNRDGTVTLEEYKKGMKRNPELIATLGGSEFFKSQVRKWVFHFHGVLLLLFGV